MEPSMERYSRQFLLPQIGREGQQKISAARVAIVGMGALGSVSAQLWARAGVGLLSLIDRDVVEWSNLQRQVLYTEEDAKEARAKASAAKQHLQKINSEIQIESLVEDVHSGNVADCLAGIDLILDGTDNFETRYLLNDFALKNKIPFIYGGAIETRGMVYAVLPDSRPCLKCLFPESPAAQDSQTCDRMGVLASAAHITASLQFTQGMQFLVSGTQQMASELTRFDVWSGEFKRISAAQLIGLRCFACENGLFTHLEGRFEPQTTKLCGRNAVQIQSSAGHGLDWDNLSERWKGETAVQIGADFARVTVPGHEFMLFKNGRVIVKGTEDIAKAKSLYAQWIGC